MELIGMSYIALPPGMPEILGLLSASPDAARPLNSFTQKLLREESLLTPGERELIAAYVSWKNRVFMIALVRDWHCRAIAVRILEIKSS